MKLAHIAIAAVLAASASAATAQSATDARCIVLSNGFAKNSPDADAKKAAEVALYFYLGRVSDAANATQLKALLDAQAKTITDATAGSLMNACIKTIQGKMQFLQSLSPQPAKKPAGR